MSTDEPTPDEQVEADRVERDLSRVYVALAIERRACLGGFDLDPHQVVALTEAALDAVGPTPRDITRHHDFKVARVAQLRAALERIVTEREQWLSTRWAFSSTLFAAIDDAKRLLG
jgi:hypothetical protein